MTARFPSDAEAKLQLIYVFLLSDQRYLKIHLHLARGTLLTGPGWPLPCLSAYSHSCQPDEALNVFADCPDSDCNIITAQIGLQAVSSGPQQIAGKHRLTVSFGGVIF